MKRLYLLLCVFHAVAGCDLTLYNDEVTAVQGGSVLLPCSCKNKRIKPQAFTWMTYMTGNPIEVFNDERYRGRIRLFNNASPANLSLFVSNLRKADEGYYRCSTDHEYRDIRLTIKVPGRIGDPKKPETTYTTPEQTGRDATASTTLEQDHTSLPLVFGIVVLLLVIPGIVALIWWRRKGGRCPDYRITKLDRKKKQEVEMASDDSLFTTVIYTCYSTDPR